MSTESLAQPARTTTTHDQLAERIEAELARIRRHRPQLADRCDRAADLLATHLSCPGQVIRVRVGAGGRARFLVNSLNERGVTYLVDPQSWSCSCPDHHRRDAACKHGIACFALAQATAPRTECPPCRGSGTIWIGEATTDEAGHETERITGLTCSRCSGKGVL